jgi:FHA domain/Zinc-ribbon containing domain
MSDALMSGTLAGTGSFGCEDCGYTVSLVAEDALPTCPACAGERWRRASLFTTTANFDAVERAAGEPEWLGDARERCTEAGEYIAYRDGEELVVAPLAREWTRVGRSLAADIRFDDPTVSRRHALIVRQADGVRVLDDRSLNGVFVNGERVEWSRLRDGDEILVGCHELRFLDLPSLPMASLAPAGAFGERART